MIGLLKNTNLMKKNLFNYEVSDLVVNRNGKRRLATKDVVSTELKQQFKLMLQCFKNAIKRANEKIADIAPGAMSRNHYPSLVQTTLFEQFVLNKELNAKKGKNGRTVMVILDYVILSKLLDKNSKPMNIKTLSVNDILSQKSNALSLYDGESPILFFGYKKDKFGAYVDPQLVYIDENKVKFSITEQDIQMDLFMNNTPDELNIVEVKPTLKRKAQ